MESRKPVNKPLFYLDSHDRQIINQEVMSVAEDIFEVIIPSMEETKNDLETRFIVGRPNHRSAQEFKELLQARREVYALMKDILDDNKNIIMALNHDIFTSLDDEE